MSCFDGNIMNLYQRSCKYTQKLNPPPAPSAPLLRVFLAPSLSRAYSPSSAAASAQPQHVLSQGEGWHAPSSLAALLGKQINALHLTILVSDCNKKKCLLIANSLFMVHLFYTEIFVV